MFWNIYSKRLLSAFRSKDAIIWTWIFPIMLSTLFYFAFSKLDLADQFQAVKVGVIQDKEFTEEKAFQEVLKEVSKEGKDQLLITKYVKNQTEADKLLSKGKVAGYINIQGEPRLTVKEDGMDQTILKEFLDSYIQNKKIVVKVLQENPMAVKNIGELFHNQEYVEKFSFSKNPPTSIVNYFYVLLAMVCMLGGFQGLNTIEYLQPNISSLGARQALSPVKKGKMLLYSMLGGVTVQFFCILIVFFYIKFILKINFGPKTGYMILICLVGSMVGVSFGALVSCFSKIKRSTKFSITTSFSLLCCFLAGLMVQDINYMVAQKAPIVSWINPAARISDSFYCLYYYDSNEKFFLNIGILLIMAAAAFGVTAFFVRRQQYESI